jgi:hypothetical protein
MATFTLRHFSSAESLQAVQAKYLMDLLDKHAAYFTATIPSTTFQPTVRYSRRRARFTDSGRRSGADAAQAVWHPQDVAGAVVSMVLRFGRDESHSTSARSATTIAVSR